MTVKAAASWALTVSLLVVASGLLSHGHLKTMGLDDRRAQAVLAASPARRASAAPPPAGAAARSWR